VKKTLINVCKLINNFGIENFDLHGLKNNFVITLNRNKSNVKFLPYPGKKILFISRFM